MNIYLWALESSLFKRLVERCFSDATRMSIEWDIARLHARLQHPPHTNLTPSSPYLHFGCGDRKVDGFLNVDIANSNFNIDLACGRLPWKDAAFEVAIGQQVIEHLNLQRELIPLLAELRRVLVSSGELWLSCPHIEKACRSYIDHKMVDLVEGRKSRFPRWSLGNIPSSHMINHLFHQDGEHKNLFDFDLLKWALEQAGFTDIEEVLSEEILLKRFPGFPKRGDDDHSLYVKAIK